jgi:hypothetical protein
LKFGTALRTIIYPSGDPRCLLGLFEIGIERSNEAGQSPIPIDATELLLGNDEPGTV